MTINTFIKEKYIFSEFYKRKDECYVYIKDLNYLHLLRSKFLFKYESFVNSDTFNKDSLSSDMQIELDNIRKERNSVAHSIIGRSMLGKYFTGIYMLLDMKNNKVLSISEMEKSLKRLEKVEKTVEDNK